MADKRAELRKRLIDAAEARIRDGGLAGLKARDVTKDAGCALGSLYNVFADLDLLILAVNSRTLARLGAALREARGAETPERQLQNLALNYLAFALENRGLWGALFDHRMADGAEVPDWHIDEHRLLIAEVVGPLMMLDPSLGDEAAGLRARTLFSAVHGIVRLALEDRFVALTPEALRSELNDFLATWARGVRASC